MKANTGDEPHHRIYVFVSKVTVLAFLALFWSGCSNVRAFRFSTDPDKAKRQLLREVPLGTPLQVARQKLEQRGFWCQILRRSSGRPEDVASERKDPLIDCLTCSQGGSLVVTRRWIVNMKFDSTQLITNMMVDVGPPPSLLFGYRNSRQSR